MCTPFPPFKFREQRGVLEAIILSLGTWGKNKTPRVQTPCHTVQKMTAFWTRLQMHCLSQGFLISADATSCWQEAGHLEGGTTPLRLGVSTPGGPCPLRHALAVFLVPLAFSYWSVQGKHPLVWSGNYAVAFFCEDVWWWGLRDFQDNWATWTNRQSSK